MKTDDYVSLIDRMGKLAADFERNPLGATIILVMVALCCWVAVTYLQGRIG